jgi:hypothetical protein
MRALVLLGAVLLATGAGADPREVVAACAKHLAKPDVGLAAIERRCPEVREALEAIGVRALYGPATRAALYGQPLLDSLALMDRPVGDSGRVPGLATLPAALHSLGERPAESGWWQRLKAWLIEHLRIHPGKDTSGNPFAWIGKWLSKLSLSEAAFTLLYYVLLAAMLVGAGAVLINELRAAGRLPARSGSLRGAPGGERGAAGEGALSMADVENAPPSGRARLLLRFVIERLAAAGRLPGARSLTHRELAPRALLEEPGARERLANLAALAERQLFGGETVPEAALAPGIAEGRALATALAEAPGARR